MLNSPRIRQLHQGIFSLNFSGYDSSLVPKILPLNIIIHIKVKRPPPVILTNTVALKTLLEGQMLEDKYVYSSNKN